MKVWPYYIGKERTHVVPWSSNRYWHLIDTILHRGNAFLCVICVIQRLFENAYLPDLMLKVYGKLLVLQFLKVTLLEPILVDWVVAIGAVVEKAQNTPSSSAEGPHMAAVHAGSGRQETVFGSTLTGRVSETGQTCQKPFLRCGLPCQCLLTGEPWWEAT